MQVGKRLETDANAKPHMDAYFNRIKELVQKKDEVTSRVRFMMQDVIELRENKWVPRRAEAQAKTIDEVHKELEQDKLKQLAAGRNDSGRGGRNDSRGGGYNKQQQQNADGWTSVGSNTRSKADLSALRSMQTRPASTGDSTNMKLGPAGGGGGGARGWGMARTPSENKQGGAPALGPSKNAFDILSHPETHEERGVSFGCAASPYVALS
jgi:translation initiation factor 4G